MIQDTLERTKRLVWPEIEKYLKDPIYPTQFAVNPKFKKEVELFWKINKEYPQRKGKYLRPTLVLLTAEAMGTNPKKAVKTAAAMQLSEEWILIHDDIEDKSEERRGKPTLHKIYGNELALNAGDSLHIIMWKIINDLYFKEVSEEFYKMLMRTAMGQGIELIWTKKGSKGLNPEKYFLFADSKSGYYSMAGPMRLGAILAEATKEQLDKITDFTLHLGRCFQLVDDILDYDQDKEEGKITLAGAKGLKYTKELAKKERDEARRIFDKELGFLSKEPARTQIIELMNFVLERKY